MEGARAARGREPETELNGAENVPSTGVEWDLRMNYRSLIVVLPIKDMGI